MNVCYFWERFIRDDNKEKWLAHFIPRTHKAQIINLDKISKFYKSQSVFSLWFMFVKRFYATRDKIDQ